MIAEVFIMSSYNNSSGIRPDPSTSSEEDSIRRRRRVSEDFDRRSDRRRKAFNGSKYQAAGTSSRLRCDFSRPPATALVRHATRKRSSPRGSFRRSINDQIPFVGMLSISRYRPSWNRILPCLALIAKNIPESFAFIDSFSRRIRLISRKAELLSS